MKDRGVKSPDRADACVYSTVHSGPLIVQPVSSGSIASDLLTKAM